MLFISNAFWILAREDRKSTRLNSSHVRISYAVFCLKKNREHIPVPFQTRTSLAGMNPAYGVDFDDVYEQGGRHPGKVNYLVFFFNDPAPAEISPLSLHGAFPT